MKTLFGIFVSCILATTAFSEEMCLRIDGCWVDVKTGECPECVDILLMPEVKLSTSGTLYVCKDILLTCALSGFDNCLERSRDCEEANKINEG
jgi:hypothetical protein